MMGETKLPYWSEESARIWIEHLENAVQVISIEWGIELDIPDRPVKTKILQSVLKSVQYKVYHSVSLHILSRMNLTWGCEMLRGILAFLRWNFV